MILLMDYVLVYSVRICTRSRNASGSYRLGQCMSTTTQSTDEINNIKISYTPSVPFNGFKQSGFGTDNGVEAIEAWTRDKTVYYQYEL